MAKAYGLFGGKLTQWTGHGEDKIVHSTRRSTLYIGQDSICDIQLKEPNVEPFHCSIGIGALDMIQIKNLSTDNPVQLNGVSVVEEEFLKSGDCFNIADHKFLWELVTPKEDTDEDVREEVNNNTIESKKQSTEDEENTTKRSLRDRNTNVNYSDRSYHPNRRAKQTKNTKDENKTTGKIKDDVKKSSNGGQGVINKAEKELPEVPYTLRSRVKKGKMMPLF
ncbi:proliferation marker protein Ki-67-like [Phlebotomus argentipes]|uniref:proliferation marker protein Ki-67-like n=1 Tax=Phlebotomus argentipes TaxID=94469 RepID=UPI002892AC07|nr:proliferation marker protein Ki-67-like [Phlebotomus argentipes]